MFPNHDPHDEYADREGSALAWVLRPGVTLTRCRGHITLAQTRWWVGVWQEQIDAAGRLKAAVDVFDAESYETSAQTATSTWVGKRIGKIDAIYVGVSSPILRMGTAMGALASGGRVQGCSSRDEFDRLIRQMA